MVRNENSDLLVFESRDDVLNIAHGDGVDSGKRLIEQ